MDPVSVWLLAGSAFLFLATAGILVANGQAVMALVAKRRREAEPGEVVADPHRPRRGASPGAISLVLALHALALAGLIFSAWSLLIHTQAGRPGPAVLPVEADPLPRG